jgi:hypothetical protein
MEVVRRILNTSLAVLLRPFEGRDPAFSLVPLSILLGLALLWVFGRISNQQAIRATKKRLQAHMYELRLFADEPKLILKAQASLLRENVRYLGLMLLPMAVITIPLLPLLAALESFYGRSPLQPGRAAILTVKVASLSSDFAPRLELPDGVVAETPPVRVLAKKQVSWRIRAQRTLSGSITVAAGGESASKSIDAGVGPSYISSRRVSSLIELLQNPQEPLLTTKLIRAIEIDYPSTQVHWFGVDLHWIWWMLILSMTGAFLVKGRFGIVV